MADSAETMREAIKRFHRNCCYPEAFDFEVDGLMNELAALSAGETKEDDRPLSDAEIRAGINILLETIAKKFEAYDTLDIWRSDAADIVRSYKHSFSGETKSDGGAEVASSAASAVQRLQALWRAFCDADPVPPEFIDDMEKVGFAQLRSVEDADLEEAFAAERGIEPGGLLWELTDAGRRALAKAEGK